MPPRQSLDTPQEMCDRSVAREVCLLRLELQELRRLLLQVKS